VIQATAGAPGAIAIMQLVGDDSIEALRTLTGTDAWPIGRMRLANLGGIDEGLAVRLSPRIAQVMPHGGMRVVQRLMAKLIEMGATVASPDDPAIDPIDAFPEAHDRFEALTLLALARAESPLAIDLLLDQPRRWRGGCCAHEEEDLARSRRLNRLIAPPIVVLAGRPNVGKSTLSNALLGRAMSIAADVPGTTRDYTAGRIDLAGLVVDWHDTPGIRESADPIERKAIDIARTLIERADLLIAMRDPQHDWPELPRDADMFAINKMDHAQPRGEPRDRALHISALHGQGLADLVREVRDRLVPPEDLAHPGRWLFDSRLLH
jgi:small GTP-binding protein